MDDTFFLRILPTFLPEGKLLTLICSLGLQIQISSSVDSQVLVPFLVPANVDVVIP